MTNNPTDHTKDSGFASIDSHDNNSSVSRAHSMTPKNPQNGSSLAGLTAMPLLGEYGTCKSKPPTRNITGAIYVRIIRLHLDSIRGSVVIVVEIYSKILMFLDFFAFNCFFITFL